MQFTLDIRTSLAVDDAEFARLGGTRLTALHLEDGHVDLVCEGSDEAVHYASRAIYDATR